jgi:hypothetical protein
MLGTEVHAFGRARWTPGAAVVQDLGAPARQGLRQGADLGHLVVGAALDGVVQERGRLSTSSVR